jgi:alpha-beta hydrolase superfamily lysophospholipase
LRRIEAHLRGSDGARLFRRTWLGERPHRAMVLVHGYAEHSGRYEELATWFAARGVAVHGYDQRGHGRSAGPRGHVARFAEFLDDLQVFLETVRHEHTDLPLTLVGHSMGGLVTAAYLIERKPTISSAVLSGAALALGRGVSRLRAAAARVLRLAAPRLTLDSGLDPDGLSRDPGVVRRYLEDPLVFRTVTTSLAAEMLAAIPRVAARGGEVEVPLLGLHGEDDRLCPLQGSRAFFASVGSAGSAMRVYPGLRHEIFNEPEREKVYEDLWSWLQGLTE